MFVIFAAVFITIGLLFAAFVLAAGRFLAKRIHYMFCPLSPSLSSIAWRGCLWLRPCRARKVSHTIAALVIALLPFHAEAQEGPDPAARQVQLKKGDRIIFFGDSLTALAIKDPSVPEGKGYVPLVRAALKEHEFDVDAVATGGHKVTDLLKRVDQDVLAKKPAIVVIQIGVNDASQELPPSCSRHSWRS